MVAVLVVGVAGGEDGAVKLKLGVACCVAIMVRMPGVESRYRSFDAGLKVLEAVEDISKGEK
jgi:hypothetical protein